MATPTSAAAVSRVLSARGFRDAIAAGALGCAAAGESGVHVRGQADVLRRAAAALDEAGYLTRGTTSTGLLVTGRRETTPARTGSGRRTPAATATPTGTSQTNPGTPGMVCRNDLIAVATPETSATRDGRGQQLWHVQTFVVSSASKSGQANRVRAAQLPDTSRDLAAKQALDQPKARRFHLPHGRYNTEALIADLRQRSRSSGVYRSLAALKHELDGYLRPGMTSTIALDSTPERSRAAMAQLRASNLHGKSLPRR